MKSSQLRARAEHLLAQEWLPGINQSKIRQATHELEHIIAQLAHRQDPALETVLLRTHHLYERAQRQYLSGLPRQVTHGLGELMDHLEDILQDHQGTNPQQRTARYLLENSGLAAQKSLGKLGTEIKNFTHIPYSYVEAESEQIQEIIAAMRAHDLPVIPDKHYHVHPIRAAAQQPNLDLIHAPGAWEYATGAGVRIGVADSGCDYEHEELRERFGTNKGYDFVHSTEDPRDRNGHGTHVAGTVAGQNVGVAPASTLYALKFLDSAGRGKLTDFIRAAEWAIDHELHILNGSFGSPGPSPAEQAICDALQEKGILFVAAAGNGGNASYSYPASYENVMSVAAVDNKKRRAPFSQYNDQVSISAPGVDVRSCVPGGYDTYDGTSMATPHVAGSAALLRERNSHADLRGLLEQSAQELGKPVEYGTGLVRPDKALALTEYIRKTAS